MKFFNALLFLAFSYYALGQNSPSLKVNDSLSIELSHLSVKSEIVGNMATTTYKMKFYNETFSVLEGELIFPLAQGQSVTSFAMDVNGKMRNAVIVEKELGRVAYESTVRQTIDPGLLELTKGNNYKARVYPIPSNDYKIIEIIFEEELRVSDGKHIFRLPFNFQNQLEFDFEVSIYNSKLEPRILKGHKYGLDFKISDFKISSRYHKQSEVVDEDFLIEIPIASNQVVSTYSDYFNIYKSFKPKSKPKSKPETISIFWDASLSMKYREIDKEFNLLKEYFNYLQNVEVDLIVFSNTKLFEKKYFISGGDWSKLKDDLSNVKYDGGTSYLQLPKTNTEEILFFTDGMFNLGEFNANYKTNIYVINTLGSANHEYLGKLSGQNNGKYINLKRTSTNHALDEIKAESYKFLGFKNNKNISEVYPKRGAVIEQGFSVSGRFKTNTEIELLFGYGNEVEEHVIVELKSNNYNNLPKRLWAKKKLDYLYLEKENNKDKIIELAKKYHLISDFTSLIVLDRLEDYLRYRIEPPNELKVEYKERLANIQLEEEQRQSDIEDRKEELLEDYEDLKKWYNTKYPIKKPLKKEIKQQLLNQNTPQPNITEPQNTNDNTFETIDHYSSRNNQQPVLDRTKNFVTGTITTASDGLPLPGATIIIKGTRRGVTTDFDGKYAINIEPNEELIVSYVGFKTSELVIGNSKVYNIALEEDGNALEEVVVVAYSVSTKEAMTGSISVDEEETLSVSESINSLMGRASSISIVEANGNPGSSSRIIVRGYSTINTNENPLFIIDGKVYEEKDIKEIETDSIYSMTILKDANAQAVYGARGQNGVVIITTNKGLEKNREEIKSLNEKIFNDIEFKPWNPENDYIKILSAEKDIESAYSKYLELLVKYRNTPSFFLDVADFFESKDDNKLAIRVLSNLAEIDLDNHEILRALAYKLDYFKQFDLALSVYREVFKLRPEEPQSTRDLALAYENVGMYQKAFDLLYTIIDGKLLEKDENERYYGIEHIAFIEAGHLLKKHKKKISLTQKQKRLVFPVNVDLRVVADWNHNDTDLDLWVDNPKDQKINYKNKTTDYGDRLSEDMTEGYGPEEYLIKKGLKGNYNLEVDYYGDNQQKISGPTILKITIFKNYGKSNEIKEVRILRLSGDGVDDTIEIGKVNF
jgi:TonB-dependent SusC/RagA subfamily outer membrane receptor